MIQAFMEQILIPSDESEGEVSSFHFFQAYPGAVSYCRLADLLLGSESCLAPE